MYIYVPCLYMSGHKHMCDVRVEARKHFSCCFRGSGCFVSFVFACFVFIFEIGSLTGSELTKEAKLAGQGFSGICLPSSHPWLYKDVSWVLQDQTRAFFLARRALHWLCYHQGHYFRAKVFCSFIYDAGEPKLGPRVRYRMICQ